MKIYLAQISRVAVTIRQYLFEKFGGKHKYRNEGQTSLCYMKFEIMATSIASCHVHFRNI